MNTRALAFAILGLAAWPALADKGHIWPVPVALAETAQKAILLHNREEEVLVLGVELSAAREAEILEFIPFPSRPTVSLAEGDPFTQAQRLIRERRLEYQRSEPSKGGAAARAAVELVLSARIGVHDVAVVHVNDAAGFEAWVRRFFEEQGIPAALQLEAVLPVAEDYLRRGLADFVFDRVSVGKETRFAAPLAYRFRSERLYYPLKTSNIVGGRGAVELVMILPGSFVFEDAAEQAQHFWSALRRTSDTPRGWSPSSSAKLRPADAEAVYPGAAAFFGRTPKLYLQVLQFTGAYRFSDDLFLDLADVRPYPQKLRSVEDEYGAVFTSFPGFSAEEIQDYCEANAGLPPCEAATPKKGKKPPRAKR